MKLYNLIYRRNHPIFKCHEKGHSTTRYLARALSNVTAMEPLPPISSTLDRAFAVCAYPDQEVSREDLEILGDDLYAGFLKHVQVSGKNVERTRKWNLGKRRPGST